MCILQPPWKYHLLSLLPANCPLKEHAAELTSLSLLQHARPLTTTHTHKCFLEWVSASTSCSSLRRTSFQLGGVATMTDTQICCMFPFSVKPITATYVYEIISTVVYVCR